MGASGTAFFDVLSPSRLSLGYIVSSSRRALGNRLDDKRRFHVRFDLLEFREQLPVLGRGSQFPVDQVFGALRVHVAHFPQIVLFVEAAFNFLEAAFFLQLLQFFFQLLNLLGGGFLVAFEIDALGKIELGQNFGHTFVAQAFVDLVEQFEVFVQDVHEARQIRAFQLGRAFAVTHN